MNQEDTVLFTINHLAAAMHHVATALAAVSGAAFIFFTGLTLQRIVTAQRIVTCKVTGVGIDCGALGALNEVAQASKFTMVLAAVTLLVLVLRLLPPRRGTTFAPGDRTC